MSISLKQFKIFSKSNAKPNNPHYWGVILAGGGGTRLWPKSRNKTPKQFLKLTSTDTMMQIAANRLNKVVDWNKMIVVTNKLYTEEVRAQLPQIPQENIIAEPEKKDTALAMLVGSLYAKSKDTEAVVINAASDHVLTDEKEYVKVIKAAAKIAERKEHIVTVGITPTRPATGFGYIKIAEDIEKVAPGLSVFRVESFTEKPNKSTASGFISTGKYYWNANMYVWSAYAIERAFFKHMPAMYELTKKLSSLSSRQFHNNLNYIYKKAESISIDYAISEKAANLVLIPGDFGWDDVGDWKVVYDLGKKNKDGNVIITQTDGEALSEDTHDCLIHGNGRLVATVGLRDMIVVDTNEILLIAPMNKSQEVKKLVEKLKERGEKKYL